MLLDGREVATLGPGDVFGEMGLMGSTGRTADVRSGAYCELWTLAAQDLQQVTGVHGVRPDPPPSSTASPLLFGHAASVGRLIAYTARGRGMGGGRQAGRM